MGIKGLLIAAGVVHALMKQSKKVEREMKEHEQKRAEEREERERKEAEEREEREREIAEEREKRERRRAEAFAEDQRRQNTPCDFVNGFSEYEFDLMAKRAGSKIRRISKITVNGPFIYGVVQSQSGISEWYFKLDFNDYGHITGRYWLSSDNHESNIPKRLGDMVSSAVHNYSPDDYKNTLNGTDPKHIFCPHCGKQLTTADALFCAYCGTRIR